MGVRSSTAAADDVLRRALAAHLVDDPDAPANYSLQLLPHAEDASTAQPLHRLFENSSEIVRDRSPDRVVRALLHTLGGFAPPVDTHVQVWATAVVGPAGAVLAPGAWRRRRPALERALRRTGWTFLDVPFVSLDVAAGDLVVCVPPLAVDHAALAGLGDVAPGPPAPPVPAGPHPVRGWVVSPSAGDEAPSRADALVSAMRLCRNRDVIGGRRALAVLATALTAVRVAGVPRTLTDDAAAGVLAELLSG